MLKLLVLNLSMYTVCDLGISVYPRPLWLNYNASELETVIYLAVRSLQAETYFLKVIIEVF